jgi:membrane protease YdiL (CAAX protease family)
MSSSDSYAATNSWRALPLFLVLALLLSWYPWALHAAGYPGNPNPNPLGVFAAALIAASVDRGWRGPVDVLRSVVRVRAAPTLWLAAFAIPVGTIIVALTIARVQGIAWQATPPMWSDLLDRFVFTLLFIGLGEEPGWRGFLQPLLQRQLSPFVASLCVAVIWAAWHAPLFGGEFAWELVPAFLASVPAAAIVLAWLYNGSGGSSLLPMVAHTTVNTAGAGYAFAFVPAHDLLQFWWIYTGVWSAAAVAILVLTRGRLGAGHSSSD